MSTAAPTEGPYEATLQKDQEEWEKWKAQQQKAYEAWEKRQQSVAKQYDIQQAAEDKQLEEDHEQFESWQAEQKQEWKEWKQMEKEKADQFRVEWHDDQWHALQEISQEHARNEEMKLRANQLEGLIVQEQALNQHLRQEGIDVRSPAPPPYSKAWVPTTASEIIKPLPAGALNRTNLEKLAQERSGDWRDCTVAEWSAWSCCGCVNPGSKYPGTVQVRYREVTTPHSKYGKPCPQLSEVVDCVKRT